MSFLIKNDEVCEKYKQICGLTKNKLELNFIVHLLKIKNT